MLSIPKIAHDQVWYKQPPFYKKYFFAALSKSVGLIKELVHKSLHLLLSKKSLVEM